MPYCVIKTKGRTDGQHPFTHFQITGSTNLDDRQVITVLNLEYRHIGAGIRAHQGRRQLPTIAQAHNNLVGPFNDNRT